jgi:hypothetical protein
MREREEEEEEEDLLFDSLRFIQAIQVVYMSRL